MKKRIMLLGGNYFQMTATKAARDLGHHVISVDYLPDNPAHAIADEYHNVSTIDPQAVLALAKRLHIDGIASYASDVSAPTAAYVARQMGLPTNPYESVRLLTRKDLFRAFLAQHGFNHPRSAHFSNAADAQDFFDTIDKPVMVKPVDASGSKGVSKITGRHELDSAFSAALAKSRAKIVILEEFIERDGYQVAGDGFLVDGRLVFTGLMNEHFDRLSNPLVPIGESYPAVLPEALKAKARGEIQRALSLLGMKIGAINLDFIVNAAGEVYILEIGPRNGGNLIPDTLKYGCGVDLARCTIQSALGLDVDLSESVPATAMTVASYIVHSGQDGRFRSLAVDQALQPGVLRSRLFVKPGDSVQRFDHAGLGIGAMIIRFQNEAEMLERMDHMERFIQVRVE